MKKIFSFISIIFLSFLLFSLSASAYEVIDDGNGGVITSRVRTGRVTTTKAPTTEVATTEIDPSSFCVKASPVIQIIGYVLLIIKIVIPLIIIIIGSIDLSKAVISGEDKDIKESSMRLLKRVIIGIAIFLLPTIVRLVFFAVYSARGIEDVKTEAAVCIDCLTKPSSCTSAQHDIFK